MLASLRILIAPSVIALSLWSSAVPAAACSCPQMTLKVSELLNKHPAIVSVWPEDAVAVVGMAIKREVVDEHARFINLDTTFSVRKTLIGKDTQQITYRSGQTSCDVSVHVAQIEVLVFRAKPNGWQLIVCDQPLMDVTPGELLAAIR